MTDPKKVSNLKFGEEIELAKRKISDAKDLEKVEELKLLKENYEGAENYLEDIVFAQVVKSTDKMDANEWLKIEKNGLEYFEKTIDLNRLSAIQERHKSLSLTAFEVYKKNILIDARSSNINENHIEVLSIYKKLLSNKFEKICSKVNDRLILNHKLSDILVINSPAVCDGYTSTNRILNRPIERIDVKIEIYIQTNRSEIEKHKKAEQSALRRKKTKSVITHILKVVVTLLTLIVLYFSIESELIYLGLI